MTQKVYHKTLLTQLPATVLVVLFFLQSLRALAGGYARVLGEGDVPGPNFIGSLIVLLAGMVVVAAIPRLDRVSIAVSIIGLVASRVFYAIHIPGGDSYFLASSIVFVLLYLTSISNRSRDTLLNGLILGLLVDVLLRAYNTYDPALRTDLQFRLNGHTYNVSWLGIQIALSIGLVGAAHLGRTVDRDGEGPFRFSIWSGLAFGVLLAFEVIFGTNPSYISHLTRVPTLPVVPWIVLATCLPLLVVIKRGFSALLRAFDIGMRAWIWFLLLVLASVIGFRIPGIAGAAGLLFGQFIIVMTFWFIGKPGDSSVIVRNNIPFSLCAIIAIFIVVVYSFTTNPPGFLSWMDGQGLVMIMVSAVLLIPGMAALRSEDLWELSVSEGGGRPFPLVVMVATSLVVLVVSLPTDHPAPPAVPITVASYNMNGGYGEDGDFALEAVSRAVIDSGADVLVLHDITSGFVSGYGVDQALFLSRRTGMHYVYSAIGGQGLTGEAILSRWPFQAVAGRADTGVSTDSGALAVTINPGQGYPPIRLVTAVVGDDLAADSQTIMMAQFAELYANQSAVVYIVVINEGAGDSFVELASGQGGFVEPHIMTGDSALLTYPAGSPERQDSYILVRGVLPVSTNVVEIEGAVYRMQTVLLDWTDT
nr:hypothetical protein [Anaerolineae bacterium]